MSGFSDRTSMSSSAYEFGRNSNTSQCPGRPYNGHSHRPAAFPARRVAGTNARNQSHGAFAQHQWSSAPFTRFSQGHNSRDLYPRPPWHLQQSWQTTSGPIANYGWLPAGPTGIAYPHNEPHLPQFLPQHSQPHQVSKHDDSYNGPRSSGNNHKQRGKRRNGKSVNSTSASTSLANSQSSPSTSPQEDSVGHDVIQRSYCKSFSSTQLYYFNKHTYRQDAVSSPISFDEDNRTSQLVGHNEQIIYAFKDNTLKDIRFDLDISLYGLRQSLTSEEKADVQDRNELLQSLYDEVNTMDGPEEAAICLKWIGETFHETADRLERLQRFAWLDLSSPLHEDLSCAVIK